jgi:hypothetical protein
MERLPGHLKARVMAAEKQEPIRRSDSDWAKAMYSRSDGNRDQAVLRLPEVS